MTIEKAPIAQRFRGFLPVVVDIESGGFNASTDALLEIAASIISMDDSGQVIAEDCKHWHVKPFAGANMEEASLKINGIDPHHPLRLAVDEQQALGELFKHVRTAVKDTGCNRAILVGHNSWFDLGFLNAAIERTGIKRNPFHQFSSFDTATMAGMNYGQTVLARAIDLAGISWDASEAHSARYDTMKTAELFCQMINDSRSVYEANLAQYAARNAAAEVED